MQVITAAEAAALVRDGWTVATSGFVGAGHAEVVAYFARPFPAIVAALTLVVGLVHFKNGAQVMIEDYAHGAARKVLIAGVTALSYLLVAMGLFALIRLAL
mgnify:CR=1 FL=1